MAEKMRSIIDDNSILITVKLLYNALETSTGDDLSKAYTMDLIVSNEIKFSQLLTAIESDLAGKVRHYYGDKVPEETVIVHDERYPDRDVDENILQARGEMESGKGGIIKKARRRRLTAREERAIAEGEDIYPHHSDPDEDKLTPAEYVLRAKRTFDHCCSAYKSGTSAATAQPTICIRSVSFPPEEAERRRISAEETKICRFDTDDDKTLQELGFITTTQLIFKRFGSITDVSELFHRDEVIPAFRDIAPNYNISEQPLKVLNTDPVHVIPPSDPPAKGRQKLIMVILTPLLMAIGMIVARMIIGGSGMSMGIMMAFMSLVTLIAAIVNYFFQRNEYANSLAEWRDHYQDYVRNLLKEITAKQKYDVETLDYLYPAAAKSPSGGASADPDSLVQRALAVSGEIYSRTSREHPDFLNIRIGTSVSGSQLVPSVFPIEGDERETVFSAARYRGIRRDAGSAFYIDPDGSGAGNDGYLVDLPVDIAKEYAYLPNAPVMLDLKKSGTLGVVFDEPYDFQPFLSNLLLSLCYYHSPDALQCVMLCPQTDSMIGRNQMIEPYKYLPHFHELLPNYSAFAFEKEHAHQIFNRLLEILTERRKKEVSKLPHIVVIVQDEYDLKRHMLSDFLPKFEEAEDDYGISFIFCKRHAEELPKYCGQVIRRSRIEGRGEEWLLMPHVQTVSRPDGSGSGRTTVKKREEQDLQRYRFVPDPFPPKKYEESDPNTYENYLRAFRILSALHYDRVAQDAQVPGGVELFDLLDPEKTIDPSADPTAFRDYIKKHWTDETSDVTKSLSTPIGRKTEYSPSGSSEQPDAGEVVLDMHEKADGPHALVAGTTGSGKTETILTFLISLCAKYRPDQVNLLLMDMKGAGFVQRIGEGDNKLPHVVGTVTDIAGDETGTGMAYMLGRFLHSMMAEIKKRKLYLSQMNVDSVDGYTRARADLAKHVKDHPGLKIEELEKLPPLPHLFLIIDEFTELMRFSSENEDVDFRKQITSIARVGRSLGFHIILISQNIEDAISNDIRVNSKARLCLKVATRAASKEMIGTDAAASPLMPGNGRAYLLIGTGSRFEYFQSAYTGADVTRNLEPPVTITAVHPSGDYTVFYDDSERESSPDETGKKVKTGKTQLKLMVDQIRKFAAEDPDRYPEARCVFQQPLPSACWYDFEHETMEVVHQEPAIARKEDEP